MDNDNKDLEQVEDFDPTLSDDFYNNLEEAIGSTEELQEDTLPELELGDELFAINEQEENIPNVSSVEEEIFAGVDAALSEQIEQEFGREPEISSTEEQEPNRAVSAWRAIPTWTKVLVSVILVLLISVGLLFGTVKGRNLVYRVIVGIMLGNWTTEDPEEFENVTPEPTKDPNAGVVATPEPTQDPNAGAIATPEPTEDPNTGAVVTPEPTDNPDITQEPQVTPTPTEAPSITVMDDEDIINILLIGEENIYNSTTNGRGDATILVSINLNGGSLKMVSFQRDLYVSIPGKMDDKLAHAYAYGGSKRVVETIEKNFGVDVDAYVKVNFAGFENIIDSLGGLELSLTANESHYLNTTEYISKPEERNTVAGLQRLTGAQVLGYCRVRYVQTAEGIKNDAGRNYRHRTVLKAIFEQYAPRNLTELAGVMTKSQQLKGYVTVSSNLEKLAADCLQVIVEKQMFDIKTLQIPQDGLWKYDTFGDKDVVVFYPGNIDILQDFLYGEE